MYPVASFRSWYPDVRAVRIALAAGAVAGLVVIAACTDSGGDKSITAPQAPRMANIPTGDFSQASFLRLCVTGPAGNYTFVNTKLNRSRGGTSGVNDGAGLALTGNGFFWSSGSGGDNKWYDTADGGNGTTVANEAQGTPYIVAAGTCVTVLERTSGSSAFMAKIPIADGGPCDPAVTSCGGVNDPFAAATITYVSNTVGATYNHTDCLLDNGVLIPQQTSPPASFQTWPSGGIAYNDASPSTYVCDNHNNPTRAFVNYEHGATITFVFDEHVTGIIAPTATTCAEYRDGDATTEPPISVGLRSTGVINNAAPGVFFYYARVNTTDLGTVANPTPDIGFTQSISSPGTGLTYLYAVQQTQAYLYNQSCQVVATFLLNADGTLSSGTDLSMPAAEYIVGIKFTTDAAKGKKPTSTPTPLATHSYWTTVNGGSLGSTAASIDTNVK